jgi:GNAT superfamily N-acetyltransferase
MAILTGSAALTGDILIRPARPGEEEAVLDLLSAAAAWLRGRGIAQWPDRFPVASVLARIDRGEVLLVGPGLATVAVADEAPELRGPDATPAYHLSRLAVARHASGAGLGHRIVDWVAARAAAHGRGHVRLATARDNPALRRYYERAGFVHVADPPHARRPTSLYERCVGRHVHGDHRCVGPV